MNSQAWLGRANGDLRSSSPAEKDVLVLASAVSITLVVLIFVLSGKLEGEFATVVLLTGFLSAFLGARTPRFLLMSLFVAAPLIWALGDASLFPLGAPQVNLPMMTGFVIISAFSIQLFVRDQDAGIERIRRLILLFALACIPAMLSAQDIFTGAGVYLRIICPFIVMFAVLRSTRGPLDVLLYSRGMLMALLSVVVVLAVAYEKAELWVNFGDYTRVGALHLPTQDLAIFLSVMVFVIGLNYILTRNLAYLLFLPLALVLLFLTYYRTAWIGATLLIFLLTFELKKSYGRRLLLCGAIASVLYFPVVSGSLLRYDRSVDSLKAVNEDFSGRLEVDAIAIDRYLEASAYHRIFGIGLYRAKEATGLVLGQDFMIHDDYLAYFIEAGVFTVALYLAVLIELLKRSRQGKRRARERISFHMCGAATILLVTVMIMGVPGAFYTEVLSNLYVFGAMGLMLSESRFPSGVVT